MSTELKLYRVEVKRQGCKIAEFTVLGDHALAAIEKVERYYGDPASVEYVTIEDSHGHPHEVLLIHHWHGYEFNAKAIEAGAGEKQDQTVKPSLEKVALG